MSEFIPKNPETLVGFDNILAEFNEINDLDIVFTDDYMLRYDIYVGTESTADGYEVHTIQSRNDNVVLGENVFMYKPDAGQIINAIHDVGSWDKCVVYLEDFGDYLDDLEYYMLEELNTNFINYVDSTKIPE